MTGLSIHTQGYKVTLIFDLLNSITLGVIFSVTSFDSQLHCHAVVTNDNSFISTETSGPTDRSVNTFHEDSKVRSGHNNNNPYNALLG